ncbi:IclR family transcriptional regulator C-terminal domain-containing protein [Streptomyces sp. NPDC001389]|uniref:IclR family transcriptional regulator domain-containing protein n=1 Tax=Streptomyces sp. NPDC001389 TaxID=3364569 RepID=UPI0036909666
MSTYDGHRGGQRRPEPVVPAGLADLLAHLAGPPDHWDRPEGDFGPLAHLYRLTRSERDLANSMYRLGSKALARGDLERAAECLGAAGEAGHPGALFRLAVVSARTSETPDDTQFLIAEAARHGHGDAERLLAATADRLAGHPDIEDPHYIDELRQALGLASGPPQQPVRFHTPTTWNRTTAAGQDSVLGAARLVPVPVQRLARHDTSPGRLLEVRRVSDDEERITPARTVAAAPAVPLAGPVPDGETRRAPSAPVRGLLLPLPQSVPPAAPDGRAARKDSMRWWSADALRPARLTGLARNLPAVQQADPQWETIARAREILQLVSDAGAISTREITRRTGLTFAMATHLLHWLRGQHLIESIAGDHHPGARLHLTTAPGQEHELVRGTLDRLCRRLGAAVYYSQYADGEVQVVTSASGPTAPPVIEKVPFAEVAHASAVGKSLLAQLDFAGRMDHLARYRPRALTGRTITDPGRLFAELDVNGPQAGQFDLLEYSEREVCAAFPLAMPGRAACIALSLPAHLYPRLLETAHALSQDSAGILLALLLAETADSGAAEPATASQAIRLSAGTTALALP